MQRHRLTRSSDRVLAGVCGGLAEFVGWSPTSVRALYLFLSTISAGIPGAAAYLLLWWVMPPSQPNGFRLEDFRQD